MIIPFPLSTYDGKVTTRQPHEVWVNKNEAPVNIAKNILRTLELFDVIKVAVIGSEAINQFVKGLAVAREMRRDTHESEDLYAVPYFSVMLDHNDEERTRMIFIIFPMKDSHVTSCLYSETAK